MFSPPVNSRFLSKALNQNGLLLLRCLVHKFFPLLYNLLISSSAVFLFKKNRNIRNFAVQIYIQGAETKKFPIFPRNKGHNSVKNCFTESNFELHLYVLLNTLTYIFIYAFLIHTHTENFSFFFLKFKRYMPNIICQEPKLNVTCMFL